MPKFQLNGQVALVTGASQGIGEAIARAMAEAGAQVVLAARNVEKLAAVAATIEAAGGAALTFPMDVSEPAQVKSAFAQTLARFGRLDVLVNNAGITRDALAMRMKQEDWDAVLRTDLTGVHICIQQAIPPMLRQRRGRIINIASVVAQMGNPGQVNYAAAKAGVIGLTRALALELASRNITVNAVAPGFITTDMTGGLTEKTVEQLAARIPLGRLGSPADVSAAVVFLASEEAGYITGQVLSVNGGMYMA
ncbi:MAG TPA: 3-oxoacyl-[acyl-carrier-protein] reductase [Patescibacteria group bacterium]|nr:3-oxoacyl-[acyl-carrier-protein] reductase [Patescibacteria group bacterium]